LAIRAVFFDIGETLIDETRIWEGWADWLEVWPKSPLNLLWANLGASHILWSR